MRNASPTIIHWFPESRTTRLVFVLFTGILLLMAVVWQLYSFRHRYLHQQSVLKLTAVAKPQRIFIKYDTAAWLTRHPDAFLLKINSNLSADVRLTLIVYAGGKPEPVIIPDTLKAGRHANTYMHRDFYGGDGVLILYEPLGPVQGEIKLTGSYSGLPF